MGIEEDPYLSMLRDAGLSLCMHRLHQEPFTLGLRQLGSCYSACSAKRFVEYCLCHTNTNNFTSQPGSMEPALQASHVLQHKRGAMQVMLGLSSMALWVRIPLASPAAERDAGGAAEPHEGASMPVYASIKTSNPNTASAAQWEPPWVCTLACARCATPGALQGCAPAVQILRGVPWQRSLACFCAGFL